ncbi:MAG: aminoacetone oxidase family FAD-binding enzyme [Firmicutes bacterium]|nr:aminoacetone oxidase family FAD-binding enzyme [Bacillota bacterium]
MSKIVVVGAGASGIIAALKASLNNEVILIDGNDKCGKKILVTGNGKCNYWNESINVNNYFTNDTKRLDCILENKNEVLDYLYSIGIYPKVKNGYYYPASNLAASIRKIFVNELTRCNVKTLYDSRVINIKKLDNKFIIETPKETLKADKVIIATGSKAFPKTGSDGFGYDAAKKLGHKINQVLPALVGLQTNDINIKEWAGVRSDASVSLYVDNQRLTEEFGEIQLTENGISGICTFNISGLISKALYNKKKVIVRINFVPAINNFADFFDKRNSELKNRTIEELLESILNYKLTSVILKKSNIKNNSYWNDLNRLEKEMLIRNIENFELNISETNSYDKAQVCTGGIPLNEVSNNMESIYCKDLYFVGELLDVDGKCGGFNLAFAFITGYIAGSSV